jgi:predicted DNA-binding WGR domain protein
MYWKLYQRRLKMTDPNALFKNLAKNILCSHGADEAWDKELYKLFDEIKQMTVRLNVKNKPGPLKQIQDGLYNIAANNIRTYIVNDILGILNKFEIPQPDLENYLGLALYASIASKDKTIEETVLKMVPETLSSVEKNRLPLKATLGFNLFLHYHLNGDKVKAESFLKDILAQSVKEIDLGYLKISDNDKKEIGKIIKELKSTLLEHYIKNDISTARTFFLQDEKSDKYWIIETKDKKYTIKFGKLKMPNISIGEQGSVTEKEFEDNETCKKAADKLIIQKVNKGYIEQDPIFVELCNEFINLYDRKPKAIIDVLERLDKQGSLKVTYSLKAFSKQLWIIKESWREDSLDERIIEFIYRLPKFEMINIDNTLELKDIYEYGMRIGKHRKNKEFEQFCKNEHEKLSKK